MSKVVEAQRKALGKGLSALLPQKHAPAQTSHKVEVPQATAPSQSVPEKSLARMGPA